MFKIYVSVFAISLLLCSCAAQQEDISATTVPPVTSSATDSISAIPAQTSSAKLIPKHNDLIFIEFFAVT
jgi:hypothetical protein